SPFLPIGQLLAQWHRQADEAERARVLTGAEQLASIAPALGAASGPAEAGRVVPLVAAVLDRIAVSTPLALVIDDAQWADGSSLDLLAYLVAGFTEGQRLCLLITYRDTDLDEGHRLHGWLADAARLPAVSRIRLERLGFADAEELVSRLNGADQSRRLAEEVFEKSGGNPYYTELLVRASAGRAGSGAEEGLRQALLSSWHRLGRDARELLQLLALGGRPVAVGVLDLLVAARGGAPERVASSLEQATAAGLTTVGSDGEAWFHHPLVAEVVATTLSPTARGRIHREYVDALESSADLALSSRAAHLALHHHGAGNPDGAFSWSIRAADEAAAVSGYAEVCDHLHRACRLWEHVGEDARAAAGHPADLWRRASDAAWSAGEHVLAVRLREEAIAFVDEHEDPARAVRLRLRLTSWRLACGFDTALSVESTGSVLELAESRCPGTPEHVQALALHALAEVRDEEHEAVTHAATAVELARRTGSPEALAWALCTRSHTPPWERALADATEALALAHEVGDPALVGSAAVASANRLGILGRDLEAAELLLTTFRRLVDTGSVHDAMYANPAFGTLFLIDFGRWEEAREVLRLLLSHRLTTGLGALTRGVAALLALRAGDIPAGRAHLTRARELCPRSVAARNPLDPIEVEAQWAMGQPREALSLAVQLMPHEVSLDPGSADELLVICARAAADLADEPGAREEAVALLDKVEQQRGSEPASWFEPTSAGDVIHPARGTLFAADRARCHGADDTASLWRTATAACGEAGLVWHEALASYRLARALVVERGPRSEAAEALRHAARIASDVGAAPVLRDV
ncbi:MAG TPA: AAA family ATPase, partial [Pedococcus sp.]|nr:AAA family ATPase [Pedococcus sp.]